MTITESCKIKNNFINTIDFKICELVDFLSKNLNINIRERVLNIQLKNPLYFDSDELTSKQCDKLIKNGFCDEEKFIFNYIDRAWLCELQKETITPEGIGNFLAWYLLSSKDFTEVICNFFKGKYDKKDMA